MAKNKRNRFRAGPSRSDQILHANYGIAITGCRPSIRVCLSLLPSGAAKNSGGVKAHPKTHLGMAAIRRKQLGEA
jgi:hypothetical protein